MATHTLAPVEVHNHDGVLLVDSRIVADRCGVEHKATLQLIRQHQQTMEAHFGTVTFEMEPSKANGGGGDGAVSALLTEAQATFLITLCRNTQAVVEFKAALVKAFDAAKRRLGGSPAPEVLGLLHKIDDTLEAFTNGHKAMYRRVEALEYQVRTGVRVLRQRRPSNPRQPETRKAVLMWNALVSRFFKPLGLPSWEGTALDLLLEYHKVTGDRLADTVLSLGMRLKWLARSRPRNVKALAPVAHTNRWRIEV